ncbi:alpha-hydroxy-acid oxidizing protein [Sphingomonas paeninsulae]|uniref:Alpha-hydroxy-acid oxidizing protein n=1 Tax=Sphingomonas paeninsulae TaxID=2319844 RepID=A0A494T920_SPHPE|nr:alpha-hydroxy-acid oxidizing protein [Sphingomonas paeninsulae]
MVGDVIPPASAPTAIPADIHNLADYERHAEALLPADAWRHIQGGADREVTLTANRTAFDKVRLLPRVLTDLRGGNTALDLFGRQLSSPILLAPLAYQKIAHASGEGETVRAAMALDTPMIVSTLSSLTLEDIATIGQQTAAGFGIAPASLWFQLYLQEEREWSAELVRRAEVAGYEAIVLTVDTSIKRSTFVLPEGVDAANLRGMPRRTHTTTPGGNILFGTPLLNVAPRWEDLAWLRSLTKLPLLVKGILAAEDARLAIEHGADGIIVSNHGGRSLDGAPSPLDVMSSIVKAVAGRVPILLDSGIRSGSDVAKALASGATAVLMGRPQFHGLAVAGMAGVAHILHILRAELEFTMAQLGCATLADITADRLFVSGR